MLRLLTWLAQTWSLKVGGKLVIPSNNNYSLGCSCRNFPFWLNFKLLFFVPQLGILPGLTYSVFGHCILRQESVFNTNITTCDMDAYHHATCTCTCNYTGVDSLEIQHQYYHKSPLAFLRTSGEDKLPGY